MVTDGRATDPATCRETVARGYAPVNRYSVCQASFESVWALQKSSAQYS